MAALSPTYRPATFAKIIKSMFYPEAEDEESVHYFLCAFTNFARVERYLESGENDWRPYVSLCFNAAQRTLEFVTQPSPMHSVVCDWFSNWASELPGVRRSTFVESDSILEGFHGSFHGSYKVADCAFYPSLNRKWPTIALEVGYTESYENLVQNATLLLRGSRGRIGLVILVKLQPLKEDEEGIQKGFLEVWAYDHGRKKCFKLRQQQLYPRLSYHRRQEITFSWQDLLREQERNLNPKKVPPPLLLDDLRSYVDGAVERYLYDKGRWGDSVESEYEWYDYT